MIDMLRVFVCPGCGEVLEDQVFYDEIIDTKNDEVHPGWFCLSDNRRVEPKLADGVACYEKVDHERWAMHVGLYDEDEDWDWDNENGDEGWDEDEDIEWCCGGEDEDEWDDGDDYWGRR